MSVRAAVSTAGTVSCGVEHDCPVFDADEFISTLSGLGYVIVPKEPSEGMIAAHVNTIMAAATAARKDEDTIEIIRKSAAAQAYRAMLLQAEKESN